MAPAKKRTSVVWEFLEEPDVYEESCTAGKVVKKIRCKLCDLKLSDGGGMSNLMSHLKLKHPEEHERINSKLPAGSRQTLLTGTARICSLNVLLE